MFDICIPLCSVIYFQLFSLSYIFIYQYALNGGPTYNCDNFFIRLGYLPNKYRYKITKLKCQIN